MNISIFGTGYVGLVTGTCLAELGHDVLCVDIDTQKIENLKKGIIPIYEPGLEELVLRNYKEGRLQFSTDQKEGIAFGDAVFNAVGTPPKKDGSGADLRFVYSVAQSFATHMDRKKILINKSTVPVGTARSVSEYIRTQNPEAPEFEVCSNPEFLREGAAVKDFFNPDRIVCGCHSQWAKKILEQIYTPVTRTGRPLLFTKVESAELIKYASNSFLATKISFINEVANFSELCGADIKEVSKGMGMDSRIGSRFLQAGIGYGGSCFPKDVQALIESGHEQDYDFSILQAVENRNQNQKLRLFEKLKHYYPNLEGKTIALWGLAFKPRTDDMRDAPSIYLIDALLEAGAYVQVFDPVAIEQAKSWAIGQRENLTYANNRHDALQNADAMLVVTEWDEFRVLDFTKIKTLMKRPLILDGRNIYDQDEVTKAGIEYDHIG